MAHIRRYEIRCADMTFSVLCMEKKEGVGHDESASTWFGLDVVFHIIQIYLGLL